MNDGAGRDQPVIPDIDLPDHIDGKRFYIRRKLSPNYYWHVVGDEVMLSTQRKSQFRVSIQDTKVKDAVIVGSDSVSLTYIDENGGYPVSIDSSGLLVLSQGRTDYFKFAAFEGGFGTYYSTLTKIDGDVPIVRLIWGSDDMAKDRRGDEWELC